MKIRLLITVAGGALAFATPASAQVRVQQQQDIWGQLLGAVFGTNQQASEQVLESDWDQGRRPFADRRASLETRIDNAVQDGTLSRNEADQIRREYYDIVRLESQYSASGSISRQQRSDLRMRYRALSQRVGNQTADQDYDDQRNDNWQPLSTRSREFEQRVTTGLRNRTLTQSEAIRLRADWRQLRQIESSYQRGGIDDREQADLWARYDNLDARLGGGVSGGFGNDRYTQRWSRIEARLVMAEQNGRISRNDASHVRAHLGDLARLDAAYASDGFSADERAYLTRRYTEIDQMLGYNRR